MGSGPSKPEEKLRELEERVRDQERFMMMMILRGVVENIGHDGRRNTRDDTERREAAAAREEVLIRELKESVKAAEEAKRRCEEIRKEAEEKVATAQTGERNARAALEEAEQELRAANEAREEAERNLRNGIRPIIIPTQEQWEATKRRLDYRQGFFHIAVAGVSGSGKSSLINAFRGLRNRDKTRGAAPVGITETTGEVTRYSDPDPERHLAWYDVPGAGTLDIPDWQYFTDQGLYVFNCILVVVDIRFTETDIAILRNCARFQIPSFIVRSKSSQHIRNMLSDMDSDEEDDAIRYEKACNEYNEETRSDYARILDRANLLAQRIYLVDKDVLLRVTRGESPEDVIDEKALCADMLALAAPVAL